MIVRTRVNILHLDRFLYHHVYDDEQFSEQNRADLIAVDGDDGVMYLTRCRAKDLELFSKTY